LKKRWPARQLWIYSGLLAGCLAIAVFTDWTSFATPIDSYAYDLIYRAYPPRDWPPSSAVLAIDEATFTNNGGVRNLRGIVADSLDALAPAKTKAIAIDVILPDASDAAVDARLATAMERAGNVVLSAQLTGGVWEDPLPLFQSKAKATGHVHPEENHSDGVGRKVPLELAVNRERRWALALEAFRLSAGAPIVESVEDLQVGSTVIPARRDDGKGRLLWIRHRPAGIPTVSLQELHLDPAKLELFRGKTAFIGVTALAGRRDQVLSPVTGDYVSGVVIHAQAFETLSQNHFLTDASNLTVVGVCLVVCALCGLIFVFLSGWVAYAAAGVVVAVSHAVPVLFLHAGIVFPFFAVFASAWLSAVCAAGYQYFVVRKQLIATQGEKERYQQAIQWVAHEMRSPLTAIQGSSEMMGRYALSEERRKQMAGMIHSESKRMARMIQTFLDVERLSEGQMEMKREVFDTGPVVDLCLQRVAPLAERKNITVHCEEPVSGSIAGDRELLEYAIYNLLTNAVKYSPADTHVFVSGSTRNSMLRIAVADQGIGMEKKEVENIFRKFYRTEKAQKSGEAGTGIGLSIVEQIVTHHGGKIEVISTPGKGSVFTIAVPLAKPTDAANAVVDGRSTPQRA
jgi:signal transduction histidine kinase